MQARTIPAAAVVSGRGEFDSPVRVRPPQLFNFVSQHGREVDIRRGDLYTQAETGSVEVHQIVEQSLHRRAAANQAGCRNRYLLPGVQSRQVRCRRYDRIERTTHG